MREGQQHSFTTTTRPKHGRSTTISFLLLVLLLLDCCDSLQISPLLSTVVDACQRGCHEIRKVQTKRINNNDRLLTTELKDDLDPRSVLTEADGAAQRAIIGSLRAEWGNDLRIIGEEEEDDDDMTTTVFAPLKRDMFEDDIPSDGTIDDIEISKITIFVDPLDGTREFVEGRLENCQVLVGIAVDGEAIAGAVGIPFPYGNNEEEDDLSSSTNTIEPTIVYGVAEYEMAGILGTPLKRGTLPLQEHRDRSEYPTPHHATGDSTDAVMEACRYGAIDRFGGSTVIYGGAGNKILACALETVSCSIQHQIGGPWDLCAPEAVLRAMGGKMTDLFGDKIDIYREDYKTNRRNERGYLATPPYMGEKKGFHDALVKAMRDLPEVQDYQTKVSE